MNEKKQRESESESKRDDKVVWFVNEKEKWESGEERCPTKATQLFKNYGEICQRSEVDGLIQDCGLVIDNYHFMNNLIIDCENSIIQSFSPLSTLKESIKSETRDESPFYVDQIDGVKFDGFQAWCSLSKMNVTLTLNRKLDLIRLYVDNVNNGKEIYLDCYFYIGRKYDIKVDYSKLSLNFLNWDVNSYDFGYYSLFFSDKIELDYCILYLTQFVCGQGIARTEESGTIILKDIDFMQSSYKLPFVKVFKQLFGNLAIYDRIILPPALRACGVSIGNDWMHLLNDGITQTKDKTDDINCCFKMIFDNNRSELIKYLIDFDKEKEEKKKAMLMAEYSALHGRSKDLLGKDVTFLRNVMESRRINRYYIGKFLRRYPGKISIPRSVDAGNVDSFTIYTRKIGNNKSDKRLFQVTTHASEDEIAQLILINPKWLSFTNKNVLRVKALNLLEKECGKDCIENIDETTLSYMEDECEIIVKLIKDSGYGTVDALPVHDKRDNMALAIVAVNSLMNGCDKGPRCMRLMASLVEYSCKLTEQKSMNAGKTLIGSYLLGKMELQIATVAPSDKRLLLRWHKLQRTLKPLLSPHECQESKECTVSDFDDDM